VDELRAALAFDRAVRIGGARRTIELDRGLVVLHDHLPTLPYLNALLLDAPLERDITPPALERLADEQLGHLGHRHLVLDDAPAAERLAPVLQARGWSRQRTLFMVWRGEPPAIDPRGREITEPELRRLQRRLFAEERGRPDPVKDTLIDALVAGQDAVRAGTAARCFGAGDDGGLSSSCTLFLGTGGVAMIDEVGTLTTERGRGLGRAVVTAAIAAALRDCATLIVVPTDADDWPQLMYARLGFEPAGLQVAVTLTAPQ
jgi:hypothetical protein